MCSCQSGYVLAGDNLTCTGKLTLLVDFLSICIIGVQDINECSISDGYCSDVCTNFFGSYICSCYPGYQLDVDGTTCIGMVTNILLETEMY